MPTTAVETPTRRRRRGGAISRRVLLYALPALAFYVFVVVVPTVQGGTYAFTDWDGLRRTFSFVGLDNVVKVVTSPTSGRALVNTLVIAVAFTVVQNVIGLLLAVGVNSRIKSANVVKVLIFTPVVMTPIVVGFLWQYLLSTDGPINSALRGLGLGDLAQTWLGDANLAIGSIVVVLIWQFAGYSMVIFVAGLQSVPEEIIEAAAIDGAGSVRRFFHVVLPQLGPAVTINVMLSMIGSLKLFDQVWALTGGGPGGLTHTLTTLMLRDAFDFGDYGKAIALALVLFLVVVIISVFQYRFLIRRNER